MLSGLGARLCTGAAGEARRNGSNRRPGPSTSRIAGAGQRPGVRPDAGEMLRAPAVRLRHTCRLPDLQPWGP